MPEIEAIRQLEADSLAELAGALGIDAHTLEETAQRFNSRPRLDCRPGCH